MNDKHTDGPWAADRSLPQEGFDGWWLRDDHKRDIGWINGGDHNEHIALLAAAAPELLAALDALLSHAQCIPALTCKHCDQARAAIAKAKGEPK